MDINLLLTCLQNSLSGDMALMKAAESQLRDLAKNDQFCVSLLQVVLLQCENQTAQAALSASPLCQPIRLAAAIAFKNHVSRFWASSEEDLEKPIKPTLLIPEEMKKVVRNNIVEAICNVPKILQKQIALALKVISGLDFPEKFPQLIPKVKQFITNKTNFQLVDGAIVSLLSFIKNYKFFSSSPEEVGKLDAVFAEFQNDIIAIGKNVVNENAEEAAHMINNIVKILYISSMYQIPTGMRSQAQCELWMDLLLQVLVKDLTFLGTNYDSVWWKAKTNVMVILERWASRYCSKSSVNTAEEKNVCVFFRNVCCVNFINACLSILDSYTKNYQIPYATLKPHFDSLFTKLLFPLLALTNEEIEKVKTDEVDFLVDTLQSYEGSLTPKTGAKDFIVSVATYRGKNHLMAIMNTLAACLKATQANPALWKEKEAALSLINILNRKISATPVLVEQVPGMLKMFVLPELASQNPLLRANAIYTFGMFFKMLMKTPSKAEFLQALTSIVPLFSDPSITVRVYTCIALRYMVGVKEAAEFFTSQQMAIINMFLTLLRTLDLEDISQGLANFVERFSENLVAATPAICQEIIQAFCRTVSQLKEQDDSGIDAKMLVAVEYLKTLLTLIDAAAEQPQVIVTVLPQLCQLLKMLFTTGEAVCTDFIDISLEMLTELTLVLKQITPELWELFPMLFSLIDQYGVDLMEVIIPPVDNFISYGSEYFLSQPRLVEGYFNAFKKAVTDEQCEVDDRVRSLFLPILLFQHCKGRVDDVVKAALPIFVEQLGKTKSSFFSVMLLVAIANCFYYNASLSVSVLQPNNALTFVFVKFFEQKRNFVRLIDKKVAILGIMSIFRMPFAQLPADFQNEGRLAQAFSALALYFSNEYARQEKLVERELKRFGNEDGDDGDDESDDDANYAQLASEIGDNDPDDDSDDETAGKGYSIGANDAGDDFAGDDEDDFGDDDGDDGWDGDDGDQLSCGGNDLEQFDMLDDEEAESPLDFVDPVIYLAETVQACFAPQSTESQYKKMYTGLTQKDMKSLKRCTDSVQKRKKKLDELAKEYGKK